jgi:hypothetical protein
MFRTPKPSSNRDETIVSYVSLTYRVVANLICLDISVVKAFESALNLLKAQGYGR